MIEAKLRRDWLKQKGIKLEDVSAKDIDKLFEEFVKVLAKQNDLDFILDRILYGSKVDTLSDWQEEEEF